MQKCVTIYSNIYIYRTTHKYGNILQMKIEKYLTAVCTYMQKSIHNEIQTGIVLHQKCIKQFV